MKTNPKTSKTIAYHYWCH